MKMIIVWLIAGLMAFTLAPVKQSAPEKNFSLATVDKMEGVYVFNNCRPQNQFDVIGTIDVKQKWTGEPKEQMKSCLALLHKNFPGAEGVIFTGNNMQSAQAITFPK